MPPSRAGLYPAYRNDVIHRALFNRKERKGYPMGAAGGWKDKQINGQINCVLDINDRVDTDIIVICCVLNNIVMLVQTGQF